MFPGNFCSQITIRAVNGENAVGRFSRSGQTYGSQRHMAVRKQDNPTDVHPKLDEYVQRPYDRFSADVPAGHTVQRQLYVVSGQYKIGIQLYYYYYCIIFIYVKKK